MITRRDLADQFSDIVKQEIKNHNDMVLACNSSLDEFRRKIEEITSVSNRKSQIISESLDKTNNRIGTLDESINKNTQLFTSQVNDLSAALRSSVKQIKDLIDKRDSYFLTLQGFEDFQTKIDEWMAHIKVSFYKQQDVIKDENKKTHNCLLSIIEEKISEVKKEIKLQKEEKKEINKSLDLVAVNFGGLTKEIESVKKRCFVIEKNIENVYTQIERLKVVK